MTLKEAVADVQKGTKTNGSSKRTPSWYGKRKDKLILDMCTHENPQVRIATLTNELCPVTQVNNALENETDSDVLRALLLSGNPSDKAIEAFVETPLADQFDDDEEVTEHIMTRLGGSDSAVVRPGDDPSADDFDDED